MRFKEMISRITGFSAFGLGASWNAPESEVATVRRIISFMEDRRVLYVPSEVEVPEHCVQSILHIREFLTAELGAQGLSESLSDHIRAMRAECRKFSNRVEARERSIVLHANHRGHYASWEFMDALGQLRGVFGVHLAQLAVAHELDIEDDLATILPAASDEADS